MDRLIQGGLVLSTCSGFHLFDPETGATIPIADPEALQPDSRFNDGATDPRGRFWTTNGLAFAPDGRTIWRAAYDAETGTHTAPEPFFDTRAVAGRPIGSRPRCGSGPSSVHRRPRWPAFTPVR